MIVNHSYLLNTALPTSKYLLTIITVAFNAEKSILNTLKSLDNLPFRERVKYLYIVIDGFSTDGTIKLAKDYIYRDDFDVIILTESDLGIYDAMNKGLRICSNYDTDWFMFLNSDDVFSESIAGVNDILTALEFDVLAFSCEFTFVGRPSKIVVPSKHCSPTNPAVGLPFLHQSSIYSSKLLTFGDLFDTRFSIAADYSFMIRFYSELNIVYLPLVLTRFADSGVSSKLSPLALKVNNFIVIWNSSLPIFQKTYGILYQLSEGFIYSIYLVIKRIVALK